MKLGFLTAPLPDVALGEIATWAAASAREGRWVTVDRATLDVPA